MYPQSIVNMAREYIDLVDTENSGVYGGDEVSDIESERRVLHLTLNTYLSSVWKKAEVKEIPEMYDLCRRIIMGSNLEGR